MRTVFFATMLFLLLAGSLYALDTKGLVLYLPFNEGSGAIAKDASGNKNNGELVGNVQWVNGKQGKAIKVFDDAGGNMVVVKDNDMLDITDAITFGGWVNIETMPDNHCSFITKADTYMIHQSNWSGKGIEHEPLLWPFDAWQTPASVPIQLNEWHHVIGVFDGSEIKTYIDGQLMGQRAYTSKIAVTENNVVIGRDSRSCCNARKATMSIDEIVIFNRALSESDIRDIMTGNIAPVQPRESISTMWGQIKAEN